MKRTFDRNQQVSGKDAKRVRDHRSKRRRVSEDSAVKKPAADHKAPRFEVEVLDGLAAICRKEIAERVGGHGEIFHSKNPAAIAFEYTGRRGALLKLRTAVAVFEVLYFKVPHPLSIVQGAHVDRLIAAIVAIRSAGRFSSFRIGAAGSDSKVFQKIKRTIELETGLVNDEEQGQMSIRFRRSQVKPFGWDVLIRLTPLPLSARAWRVENMPGALNATIAAAMIREMDPKPHDRFLNVMCGSGTLLAERAAICPAKELIGVDTSRPALEKARANLSRVKVFTLVERDARRLPLRDASVNAVCADLPWGRLIGEKQELERCYVESLREMTRVCEFGGRLAVITQESSLFDKALDAYQAYWTVMRRFRVKQSEYKPTVYLMERGRKPFVAE